jgi:hypothetical protein
MSRKAPAPISGTSSRRELLLGIVAVALVARVAATLLAGGEAFRFVDEAIYVDAAQRLRSGAGFGVDYTNVPGYPAFLALLGVVVPGGVLALRAGQATLVALGALLCFALGRRLDGDRAGLAAAALYGLDPVLVVSAVLLYPEAIAGLLLTGSLLAAWEALRRDRLFLVFVAAVHLGVFTLFRPVGLVLVPVMVGWLGLAPGRSWKRKTTYVAVLTGVWLLVLLPWIYRGYRVHGRILPVATIRSSSATRRAVIGASRMPLRWCPVARVTLAKLRSGPMIGRRRVDIGRRPAQRRDSAASARAGTMRAARWRRLRTAVAVTTTSLSLRALVLPTSTSPSRRGTR